MKKCALRMYSSKLKRVFSRISPFFSRIKFESRHMQKRPTIPDAFVLLFSLY